MSNPDDGRELVEVVAKAYFEAANKAVSDRYPYLNLTDTWEGTAEAVRECTRAGIAAALTAIEASGRWRIVPVEPTSEMIKAGNDYDSAGHSWGLPKTKHGLGEYIYNSDGVWSAMLSASPKATDTAEEGK